MSKRFIYLVQTGDVQSIPLHYRDIPSDDADVLYLNCKKPVEQHIYFPESTWAQGRNKLLEEAKKKGIDYLYYVFLDDDVVFQKGNWRELERLLLKYKPAATVSSMIGGVSFGKIDNNMEVQQVTSGDAILTVCHRDVVQDGLALPYIENLDHISWNLSPFLQGLLFKLLYRDHVLLLNRLVIENLRHSRDDINSPFDKALIWFADNILKRNMIAKTRLIRCLCALNFNAPLPANMRIPNSYTVDEKTKRTLFSDNFLTSGPPRVKETPQKFSFMHAILLFWCWKNFKYLSPLRRKVSRKVSL